VQTVEMGYRTTLFEALYVDLNYYYSWYQDFIGFSLLLDVEESQTAGLYNVNNVYRISTNATDQVTTQGFSAGLNYYFGKYYMVSGNYTWNVLNTATDDPIIPAFNTPENKYNISFGARDMPLWSNPFGFNVTYKWIQGFIFEGSPQFTGPIDTYDLMDAQVNYRLKSLNTTVKLGVSNLLNNEVFQVYGGPRVGRLAYVSFLYEFR
jgi:outer membrane receptor for ferrienterochelin and colicin